MAGPLSVDEILARQKADKEAAAKPKFLTKAQREALAVEKRNAEAQQQKEREEVERKERIEFEKQAEEERRRSDAMRYGTGSGDRYGNGHHGNGQGGYDRYERNGYGGGGRDGYGTRNDGPRQGYGRDHRDSRDTRDGPRDARQAGPSHANIPTGPRGAPTGPRAQNGHNGHNGHNGSYHTPHASSPLVGGTSPAPSSPKPTTPGDVAMPTDSELSTIRARYLGEKINRTKPRLRKQTDKKFIFDWKAEEDTSGDSRIVVDPSIVLGARGGSGPSHQSRDGTPGATENYTDALERRRAGRGNNDDRHWTEKPLEDMKDRDWRIFREDFGISARGGSIPLPLRSWRESAIPEKILDVIDEVGYVEPSPIQRQAIPIGMQNRDLIGIAKTGSGKTAAFVIPMLEYISHLPPLDEDNRHLGPYALIMAPTRELAQQIEVETAKFASKMGYISVPIVGGKAIEEQQFALRNGAHIIIATPGRLSDMISKSMMVMSQCRYVVLDEADRMVDLGFEEAMTQILDAMPSTAFHQDSDEIMNDSAGWKGHRVTTLFSATMPPAVQRLAMKYLRKPATVTIGNLGEVTDTVEQRVEFVQGEEKKKKRLQEILRTIGLPPPFIIFVNQKKACDVVVKYVREAGFSAITLHSGKSQAEREESLQSLKDGVSQVLVATDVAGRGLDISDVSLVVNFAMASDIEKYTHRIGRTGRAGKTGLAITFLENTDDETFFDLRQAIEKSKISTMNPELARHEASRQKVTREMKRKRDEEEN